MSLAQGRIKIGTRIFTGFGIILAILVTLVVYIDDGVDTVMEL